MITYDDLMNSIYDSCFFEKPASSFTLSEKQNASDKLNRVAFSLSGNAINIRNEILSKTSEGYRKISESLSFRKDCDGLVLIDKDDKHYLVFIELKSGFGDVANKAVFQIASSYVRLKHYLSAIDTYSPNDYQEIGIIISYPYKTVIGDREVLDRRNGLINSAYSSFINRCKNEFKNGNPILINSSDFKIDQMNLSSNLQINNLKVINVQVTDGVTDAAINLDNYLV